MRKQQNQAYYLIWCITFPLSKPAVRISHNATRREVGKTGKTASFQQWKGAGFILAFSSMKIPPQNMECFGKRCIKQTAAICKTKPQQFGITKCRFINLGILQTEIMNRKYTEWKKKKPWNLNIYCILDILQKSFFAQFKKDVLCKTTIETFLSHLQPPWHSTESHDGAVCVEGRDGHIFVFYKRFFLLFFWNPSDTRCGCTSRPPSRNEGTGLPEAAANNEKLSHRGI